MIAPGQIGSGWYLVITAASTVTVTAAHAATAATALSCCR